MTIPDDTVCALSDELENPVRFIGTKILEREIHGLQLSSRKIEEQMDAQYLHAEQ
jgi:hypothetical protein